MDATKSSSSSHDNNLSVLIVEDNPTIRRIHDMLLKSSKVLKTHAVENGKKAVELYESGANFDLILMDKEMPEMDGVEATRKLRAMGVTSTMVGVTSSSNEIDTFLEAGLDKCFSKPLTKEKVDLIIKQYFSNEDK